MTKMGWYAEMNSCRKGEDYVLSNTPCDTKQEATAKALEMYRKVQQDYTVAYYVIGVALYSGQEDPHPVWEYETLYCSDKTRVGDGWSYPRH